MAEETISLIVFSNENRAKNVFETFRSLGDYSIEFSEKTDEAIDKFAHSRFHAAFVEIDQPLISEVEYVEKLKYANENVNIIVISGFFQDTKDNVFGRNISHFIPTPLTLDKLYKIAGDLKSEAPATTAESHTIRHMGAISTEELDVEIQADLQQENKRLSILLEISKNLVSITDFDVLLQTIVEHAKDAIFAERATLFLLDKSTNELWSREGTGIQHKEIRFSAEKGIAGEVVTNNEFLISDDPYSHPKFNKEFDLKTGFTTRSLLCVPLRNLKGEVLGAFQVLNKIGGNFAEEDVSFLNSMATSTAIALDNIFLQEDNKKKYEEMEVLYQDLFTAQNTLIRETKTGLILQIKNKIDALIGDNAQTRGKVNAFLDSLSQAARNE